MNNHRLFVFTATPNSTTEIATSSGNVFNADSSVASTCSMDDDEEEHIQVKKKSDSVSISKYFSDNIERT